MFFKIETFGCQMNDHDSEVIAGMLENMGYIEVQEPDQADLILLNTCCVRETAENKAFSYLGRLRRRKEKNPGLFIGVCGCMPQQEGMAQKIKKSFPYVDLVIGTHNTHQLPDLIKKAAVRKTPLTEIWTGAVVITENLPVKRREGVRTMVTIMYGCNNYCSYCIVPYVRGKERSRRPEDIFKEVEEIGKEGYKEVILLGQNVNSYGKDLKQKVDFADLLVMLEQVEGIERIRYMTSHPRDFNEKLIRTIAVSKKVCEHFHLPVQAGSNRILKKMGRGYSREDYLLLIKNIREAVPGSTVTTDIMVGFPGESERDFNDTLDLVKKVRFDSSYTFIYNNRPGTPASKMEEQVSWDVKRKRINTLIELQSRISLESNQNEIGMTQEVLAEGVRETGRERFLYGRNRGNKIVFFEGDNKLIGRITQVKITGARLAHLSGEIVQTVSSSASMDLDR